MPPAGNTVVFVVSPPKENRPTLKEYLELVDENPGLGGLNA